MGFFKELSRYMVKYGEIAINKAEILAQLAKVKIEIKKREMEIEKVKIEIGEYVISRFEKKEPISNDIIEFNINHMNGFKQGINELKLKFEDIKAQLWAPSDENKDGK